MRDLLLLVAKDLRIEGRRFHGSAMIAALGLMITAVLALGFGPGDLVGAAGAAAILWVVFLFGGALFFERTMEIDREGETIAALLMTPVDRGVLFASKLLVNLVLMIGLGAVVTPAAVVFFHLDLSAAPVAFVRITLLSLVGYAAVGTLFAGAASSARLPAGLLALLIFPLSVPLILASTRQVLAVSGGQPGLPGADAVLVAFATLFVVAGWLCFEFLLEP